MPLNRLIKPLAALAFFLATVAVGPGMASPLDFNRTVAAAAEIESEGAKTRFKVTLSRPVDATAHVMERPDRVKRPSTERS